MKNLENLVGLSLGSNLGKRVENLEAAYQKLPLNNKRISLFYETKALVPEGSDKSWDLLYLNAVVLGSPIFSLTKTFEHIKKIEKQLGRKRSLKWAPRPIDIDLLFWGNKIISTNFLTIPHRFIAQRDFVLIPLNNIIQRIRRPNIIDPFSNNYYNAAYNKNYKYYNHRHYKNNNNGIGQLPINNFLYPQHKYGNTIVTNINIKQMLKNYLKNN